MLQYVHYTHMESTVSENATVDVLICGAGATGLTLAIELARRNVSFRLIDKLEASFRGSRGKGIQPRTQEVFEDLGILDRAVAAGGLYPSARDYHSDGTSVITELTESTEPTPAEPYRMALMVPQFLTERVLRERLAELGHTVLFGRELVGFEQDLDGVTATLVGPNGQEELRGRYLVGADGGRSAVRGALGVAFPGQTLGVRAMVADVELTGLDRNAWHRFNGSDRENQLSICPLAGTTLFQVQAPIPNEGEADLSADGIGRLITERTGRSDVLVSSVSWASAYSMNARLADRYRVEKIFIAGDAAHVHPPTGGQGLNTSIQDAYNLGWKLAAVLGGASEALLNSYEQERRPVAADMLGLATRLLGEAQSGSVRRGRESYQLDIGYVGSSLTLEAPVRAAGLAAGARAPDAPLLGAGEQPTRLFEKLSGVHWTLIGYEAAWQDAPAPHAGVHVHRIGSGGDLKDMGGYFAQAYDVAAGSWILVRPDGYIAAIVEQSEIDTLFGFARQFGLMLERRT